MSCIIDIPHDDLLDEVMAHIATQPIRDQDRGRPIDLKFPNVRLRDRYDSFRDELRELSGLKDTYVELRGPETTAGQWHWDMGTPRRGVSKRSELKNRSRMIVTCLGIGTDYISHKIPLTRSSRIHDIDADILAFAEDQPSLFKRTELWQGLFTVRNNEFILHRTPPELGPDPYRQNHLLSSPKKLPKQKRVVFVIDGFDQA